MQIISRKRSSVVVVGPFVTRTQSVSKCLTHKLQETMLADDLCGVCIMYLFPVM